MSRTSRLTMSVFVVLTGLFCRATFCRVAFCGATGAADESPKQATPLASERASRSQPAAGASQPATAFFQSDQQRTGFVRDGKGLPKRPKVLWSYKPEPIAAAPGQILASVGGTATGTPLAVDGVVYFGDDGGRLHAVDAASGRKRWIYNHGPQTIFAPPCVVEGRLYFSSTGNVECVSCETGRLVWSRDLPRGAAECSPLVVGEAVFAASPDGFVYAFKREDGDTLLRASLMNDVPPDPKGVVSSRARFGGNPNRPRSSASDGQTLFQSVFDQSRVVALDCRTGRQKWSYQAGGWIYDHPAVTEKYVFVGSQDDHLHCVNRTTGKLVWKFPTGSRLEAGAAVAHGRIYFGACNGKVFCADADSGKQIWAFQTEPDADGTRAIYCAPLVTDDTVYLAAMEGRVYALGATTGAERWTIRASADSEIHGDSLATDGKRLFVSTRPSADKKGEYAVIAIGE